MSKRSSNAEVTNIMLEILRIIPKGRKIGISEIHQTLKGMGIERDRRTVERIMQRLCDNYDIMSDGHRPAGYSWKEKSQGLNLPYLTVQQSLVLMLAKEQLQHLLPPPVLSSMNPFFKQAEKTLESDHRDGAENAWREKIGVAETSQPLLAPKINKDIFKDIFNTITSALYYNQYLDVEYRNQTGHVSKKRVMPLALVQQGPSTYLVVQFDGFDNYRHLALQRILNAKGSTLSFERPRDFNLKQYIADGHFGFGEGKKVRLSFYIDKWAGFHLNETWLSEDQTIEPTESDSYKVRATVVDSVMLDWWLAKFGDDVWDVEKQPIDSR